MSIFKRKKKEEELIQIDITDDGQTNEISVEKLIDITKQLEEIKKEYKKINLYISDIQKIEMLPKEQFDKLQLAAKNVAKIESDKLTYKESYSKLTEKQYQYFSQNEDKISEIIKSVADEEKRLSEVKNNMHYLEGEKNALKIERQDLKNHLYLLQGIAKVAIISLFILFAILFIADIIFMVDTKIFLYATISVIIILTIGIFVIDRKIEYNLKLNGAKINKAITLLNKAKLLYVNAVSGLGYIYEKNDVRHSYELTNLWNEYIKLKKQKQVYQEASTMLYGASQELHNMFSDFNISDPDLWFSRLDLIIDKSQMKDMKNELADKRKSLKIKIELLNKDKDNQEGFNHEGIRQDL